MHANDKLNSKREIVRISASLPKIERDELDGLVGECRKNDLNVNKSEVVRIGLKRLKPEAVSESLTELRRAKRERKRLPDTMFHEITDAQWELLMPLIPKSPLKKTNKRSGSPKKYSERKVLNGVLYHLKTGCSLKEVPPGYGSAPTLSRMLKNLRDNDKLSAILNIFIEQLKTLDYKKKLELFRSFYQDAF
jgi:Arc/MetJ-type ribon-helix-helix transcriptional regulator